ncbi:hypothetical protein [Actinoplanes flavus]|uniref:PQQ-like domain-containing protein n=1 Tax=Actinoplanes flavus TaxID=2820290 RepID=A0ABS3UNR4_9ACTN|nr:hypothetical protein [Actinoplanes flavus]MBO3740413.1 hypothetical protein [Actinoplanes flavus]
MRPRLIAETTGHPGEFWPIATGGWMTTHYNADHLWVLDRRLNVTATYPIDDGFPHTDGRHLALIGDDEITATDLRGRTIWRRSVPGVRACVFSGDLLWTIAGDLTTAMHRTTGEPVGETRLGPDNAVVELITAFADDRAVVQLRHADGSGLRDWLLTADRTGVRATELPSRFLDSHSDGSRYLAAAAGRLTMRDVTTGAVTATRSDEEIGGPDAILSRDAVNVSGNLVVAGIEDHSAWWWRHVLLCADTLQPRSVLDYSRPGEPYQIVRSAEPGTWLTSTDDGVHLWGLDGPLDTDPLPGQLALW